MIVISHTAGVCVAANLRLLDQRCAAAMPPPDGGDSNGVRRSYYAWLSEAMVITVHGTGSVD